MVASSTINHTKVEDKEVVPNKLSLYWLSVYEIRTFVQIRALIPSYIGVVGQPHE